MTYYPIVLGGGIGGYAYLERTRDQQQKTLDNSGQMQRDVQAFNERINTITSAADLVADQTLLRVALGAFGLEGDIANKGFIQRVLESDLSDDRSMANRLGDKRYLALAETFGFNSPDGAKIPGASPFGDATSVEDLLSNKDLLSNALKLFDLEQFEQNTFFLQRVLESDLDDPNSFVNGLSDNRFRELTEAFSKQDKSTSGTDVQKFVAAFDGRFDGLASPSDLTSDAKLLKAAVDLFDLPSDTPSFLNDVLNSDLSDDSSFVYSLGDERYEAFAEAFGFGWPDIDAMTDADELISNPVMLERALETFSVPHPGDDLLRDILNSDLNDPGSVANDPANSDYLDMAEAFQNGWPKEASIAQTFVEALATNDKANSIDEGQGLVFDFKAFYASIDMFGQSDRRSDLVYMQKTLDSDLSEPTSFVNLQFDKRLTAMTSAFGFNTEDQNTQFPDGFADAITRQYLDKTFEVRVGETDPNMRLALTLESELETASATNSIDSKWYNVLASGPLRKVFETAFRLPSSFANIDIDQQVTVLKERATSQFGTEDIADFLEPENLEGLRRQFLLMSELNTQSTSYSSTASALTLLSGGY